jgi:pimeloyl-ACP methyl ester carboxylesterase
MKLTFTFIIFWLGLFNVAFSQSSTPKNFPYPVILIHGFNSDSDTWDDFTEYLTTQGWYENPNNIIHFDLNDDDDNSKSPLSDVKYISGGTNDADFYRIDFDNGELSNQAAIVKQGYAIEMAIEKVLTATQKDKVILFGHSMGGLAAREYLQNRTQADGQHHVAKLITSGTPHRGIELSFLPLGDIHSDAIRDMLKNYTLSGQNGAYLYGGYENPNLITIGGPPDFFNIDVNCNGIIGGAVSGLNNKYIDSNVDYCSIIGNYYNWGDGVVNINDANINILSVPSETYIVDALHISTLLNNGLIDQIETNIKSLDEPDLPDIAYEIFSGTEYNGYITEQAPDASDPSKDNDFFYFNTMSSSNVTINVSNIPAYPCTLFVYKAPNTTTPIYTKPINNSQSNQYSISNLSEGKYYLKFNAKPNATSWQNPYQFKVTATQVCDKPIVFSYSFVTNTTSQLSWYDYSGPQGYQIEQKIGTNGTWNLVSGTILGSQSEFQLTALTPGTTYFYRIRSICGNNIFSDWTILTGSSFTTLSNCDIPTGLTTTNITTSGVKLNWQTVSGASTYTIQLRHIGSPYWNKTVTTPTSLNYLTFMSLDIDYISPNVGLGSNTSYEWRVKTNCTNGLSSDWSSPISFTTPSLTCNSVLPSEIVLQSSTNTSLVVKCTKSGFRYKFRYRRLSYDGNGSFQVNESSNSTHTYNNLDPCTIYQVQCAIRCQSGTGSWAPYSASQFFVTGGCTTCGSPTGLSLTNQTSNSVTLNWTAVSGVSNYSIEWRSLGNSVWQALSGGTITGTSKVISISGGGTIQWRLRANCSGNPSNWVEGPNIVQQSANTLIVSPASKNVTSAVGNEPFTIESNVSWTTSDDATWVTLSPSNGSNNGTLTASFSENTSSTSRTATITVTGGGITKTVTLIQAGATNSLTISPTSKNVTSALGSESFAITSNVSWTTSDDATWVTLSPPSGFNNGAVTASFSQNTSSTSRTATITVTGGSITKTVTLIQAGATNTNCSNDNEPSNNAMSTAPVIALNTDKLSQLATSTDVDNWKFTLSSTQNVIVTLSTLPFDYDIKLFNSSNTQIGISENSSNSNESINQTLTAGTYCVQIYGYSGVYSTSQCYTLKVSGSTANTLSVSPTSKNVTSTSGSEVFSVSSNLSWTATDNASWLTLSPSSGMNNGTITATFSANSSTSSRTATITVTGGGITQTVSLVQAGISSSCNTPTGMQTTNIAQTTVNISWNPVADVQSYSLQTKVSPSGSWTDTNPLTFTGTSRTITGLSAGTTYEWRVKANCTNGNGSNWTNGVQFTTLVATCQTPTGLQINNITQNTADLSWGSVSGATGYQVQFNLNNNWTSIGSPVSTNTTGFYGLIPNANYQWRVITICSNNQQSNPSNSATFNTPTVPNCTGGTQWPANSLTPSANWQYQTEIWGGEYSVFNVQSGVTYTFSYCSIDGASLSFDGQMSIRNMSDQLLSYNNDLCGSAPKIVWQSNINGQVRVLLNKYNCASQQSNSTLAYKIGNGFTGEIEERSSHIEYLPLLRTESESISINQAERLNFQKSDNSIKIVVSPNPASDILNIIINKDSDVNIANIQIFDQLGRLKWAENTVNNNLPEIFTSFDVSNWQSSMYIIKIMTDDGHVYNKKVQVVRQ